MGVRLGWEPGRSAGPTPRGGLCEREGHRRGLRAGRVSATGWAAIRPLVLRSHFCAGVFVNQHNGEVRGALETAAVRAWLRGSPRVYGFFPPPG